MEVLYIVMPAYNEEENIESVVKQWYPILACASENSRMVIADNGSTDQTHQILLDLQKNYPQLEVLSDTGKFHGPKVIALYQHAVQAGADWVFQTDSDGQTNPDEFAAFWQLRKQHDAILGHRSVREDGKSRAVVEHVVCLLLRTIFGVKVPDANAPFRLMKVCLLKKYIGRFNADYNLPNIMLTTFFAYYKENIVFKIVSFKPRQGGINSINIPKIVKIGWKALHEFIAFKKGM